MGMKSDDRPDETIDSGMGTLVLWNWSGTGVHASGHNRPGVDVDASTPRSGVKPRLFGHDRLTLIPDAPPPTARSQPGARLLWPTAGQPDGRPAGHRRTIAERRPHTEACIARSADTSHVDTAGSASVSRIHEYGSPEVLRVTSWDRYIQVFDAIARSNGWDDNTVALQLLSHLEGDVLNVALLVPEAQRATRIGLVSALNDHYGSQG